MSVKLEVVGYLGKDPFVRKIKDQDVVILSIASRRGQSRHCDWIQGTVWNERLRTFALGQFKKGDKITASGIMGRITIFYSTAGKPQPSLDFFINSLGFVKHQEEIRV